MADNTPGTSDTPNANNAPEHVPQPADDNQFEAQFETLFRHDPFAGAQDEPVIQPGNHRPAEPVTPAPVTPPVQPVAPQAQPPAGPAASPAQVVPPTGQTVAAPGAGPAAISPETQALQQSVAALVQMQQQRPAPPSDQPAPPDPALNYMFQVPQALATALTSDDPNTRVQAMAAMHAAISKEVHTRMRSEMMQYAQTQIPQMVQSMLKTHTFRETVQREFYGAYPQLRNPHFAPLVQSTTAEVLRRHSAVNPNLTWNDHIRDEIAGEIFKIIPQLRGPANGPAAPPAPPAPPASPATPRIFNNGTRPAAQPGLTEDIMNTLF